MVKRMAWAAPVLWMLAVTVHSQAGVAGRWAGQEQSPRGATDVVLQLTVDGANVTGSVTVGENPSQALSDGKVAGGALTFKTTTAVNGKEMSVLWDGEVAGNSLTMERTFGAGGRKLPPVVLKRVQ
jgi:hypothetical protein